MNVTQYLLTKLVEEAGEVSKVALKTQQFGFSSHHPEDPAAISNRDKLYLELDDFMAAIEMLNDIGLDYVPNKNNIKTKKDKVAHYMGYSIGLGYVEP